MKAQNGQVLYAEELSPAREDVMADSQEQQPPFPSTTNAGSYEQPTPMDAGSSVQPGR